MIIYRSYDAVSMADKMTLVLLRHGESVWNKENLFTGWTDVDLSDKGRDEARAAGRLMLAEGLDFDVCYTSYLKRAIHTLNLALEEMDREWLPVTKAWQLNERHYGALQGLNKAETAQKYGEEQVLVWRRSYATPPPELDPDDERNPAKQAMFRTVPKEELPLTESLKETVARAVPYFEREIMPRMMEGQRVLIAAHGNSLRALVKGFDGLSDDEIVGVNIPTGVPLVYEFDEEFNVLSKRYLGDQDAVAAKMNAVANQGKANRGRRRGPIANVSVPGAIRTDQDAGSGDVPPPSWFILTAAHSIPCNAGTSCCSSRLRRWRHAPFLPTLPSTEGTTTGTTSVSSSRTPSRTR